MLRPVEEGKTLTLLDIVIYPDEALRTVCKEVTVFDDHLETKVNNMIETMYHHQGTVGLAAPQVSLFDRIVVIDINAKTTKDKLLILINPEIISSSQNKYCREGCLSVPDYLADIKRAKKITIKAQDTSGTTFEYSARDFESIAIQHEIDHLDGVLFIDRIDSVKTSLIRRSSM